MAKQQPKPEVQIGYLIMHRPPNKQPELWYNPGTPPPPEPHVGYSPVLWMVGLLILALICGGIAGVG